MEIIEKFKEYLFKNRPLSYCFNENERQHIYLFPNGFGVSVVNGKILHSYPFFVELAVLKHDGNKYTLTYETSITKDVLVLSNQKELSKTISKVFKLKPRK